MKRNAKSRWITRGLALVAVLAVAALVAWAMRPQPIEVEVATVSRGMFEQAVSDDGVTRVRERFVLSAPLSGNLERVELHVGDRVSAGQVVAVLDPPAPTMLDARTREQLAARLSAAEAQRQRASAEVGRTEAQVAQTEAEASRARSLAERGFISENALEQANLTLAGARMALEAARFAESAARYDVAQARSALSRVSPEQLRPELQGRWELNSPVAGTVLRVEQENAGPIALGAPIMQIADTGNLEAVVDVLSQESLLIRPGMSGRVEFGPGAEPVAARVRLIEPTAFTKVSALGVEEQRVNVVLDLAEEALRDGRIGDGFRVEARIVVHRTEDALTVPVGALFRVGNDWAVFVVQGDGDELRVEQRVVAIGRRNGVSAVVESGLSDGERVVVYPSDRLEAGSRVVLRAASRAATPAAAP